MKKFLIFSIPCLLFCFSLSAQTSNPQQYKYVFTVAKDGSGDYRFIQDAIDAMRVYPLQRITLYIKNGVYNERFNYHQIILTLHLSAKVLIKPSSTLMTIQEEES